MIWRKLLSTALLLPLIGCHGLRVGSPQIQRAPEIRCVVIVQTDTISEEVAKLAMDVCKDAIDQQQPVVREGK